ncbi:MAG TPA: class II aldolase/adducin family protein [Lachnospiraceae bacterium]|nr:class II aldolase/adducin family protein [Lachnospiraceae bacterium]
MNEREAKERVVSAGIRLVQSGLIARTWGNVSCRISDSHFAITPSGRDYLTLTPEEIVTVAIADLSYSGDIKPSGEKAVHAEIYNNDPNVNFVIHTHQDNASVISAIGLNTICVDSSYPLLGEEVICASYGLPGTKKLRKGVAEALEQSKGNAIIMRNHGAVCFGKDEEEAFLVALDLETACNKFIEGQYKKIKNTINFNPNEMRQYVLAQITRKWKNNSYESIRPYCNSERTADGFILHVKNNRPIPVKFEQLGGPFPKEIVIHNEIYRRNKNINYIIHSDEPNVLCVSQANVTLYPYVDDFAQIVGTKVRTLPNNSTRIAKALKRSSAVMIGNNGALCCGTSKGDALAVQMILEKNCKAYICGTLFGGVKPLSKVDSKLMRIVYLKKYSKQIHE